MCEHCRIYVTVRGSSVFCTNHPPYSDSLFILPHSIYYWCCSPVDLLVSGVHGLHIRRWSCVDIRWLDPQVVPEVFTSTKQIKKILLMDHFSSATVSTSWSCRETRYFKSTQMLLSTDWSCGHIHQLNLRLIQELTQCHVRNEVEKRTW